MANATNLPIQQTTARLDYGQNSFAMEKLDKSLVLDFSA